MIYCILKDISLLHIPRRYFLIEFIRVAKVLSKFKCFIIYSFNGDFSTYLKVSLDFAMFEEAYPYLSRKNGSSPQLI